MTKVNKDVVRNLVYLSRTYDGLNKLIVSTKNRLRVLNPDLDPKYDSILNGYVQGKRKYHGLEHIKSRLSRKIRKELSNWLVWTEYMEKIPGIGPDIGAKQILLYYYKCIPICSKCRGILIKEAKENGDGNIFVCVDCKKKAKGEGNLNFKIEERDFPMISSWWHFLGLHNVPACPKCRIYLEKNGKELFCKKCKKKYIEGNGSGVLYLKPKKRKRVACDWSNRGRASCFQIGNQFIKQKGKGHLYREYYDERRAARDKTHPKAKDGYKLSMARNETVKLFQSHFWQVARTLDGKPLTEPYPMAVQGHTNKIEPYYF